MIPCSRNARLLSIRITGRRGQAHAIEKCTVQVGSIVSFASEVDAELPNVGLVGRKCRDLVKKAFACVFICLDSTPAEPWIIRSDAMRAESGEDERAVQQHCILRSWDEINPFLRYMQETLMCRASILQTKPLFRTLSYSQIF